MSVPGSLPSDLIGGNDSRTLYHLYFRSGPGVWPAVWSPDTDPGEAVCCTLPAGLRGRALVPVGNLSTASVQTIPRQNEPRWEYFEFFHNSRLIGWIRQNKIYKKLTDLVKDWTQIACSNLTITLEYFLSLWGWNWIPFMHWRFSPIRLINLIKWKSLYFENKLFVVLWRMHQFNNWSQPHCVFTLRKTVIEDIVCLCLVSSCDVQKEIKTTFHVN